VNPIELNGSKTAVYMATVSSDAEYVCINSDEKNHLKLLGISKCFHSNRVSNFFNLQGPSTMMESAYGGGLQAVREAVSLIRSGRVDAALVGGAGLAFSPEVSYHLDAMSKLSHTPVTAPFSSTGTSSILSQI
jgi:acyl transferase domain-containing protein